VLASVSESVSVEFDVKGKFKAFSCYKKETRHMNGASCFSKSSQKPSNWGSDKKISQKTKAATGAVGWAALPFLFVGE
jgi:hypothetical protein